MSNSLKFYYIPGIQIFLDGPVGDSSNGQYVFAKVFKMFRIFKRNLKIFSAFLLLFHNFPIKVRGPK